MPEFAFAFIDCEFGGLDPELHDITEIAAIVTDYRLVELGAREWKVRARAERITAEAAAISGYTPEAWAEALPLRQALGELGELLPRGPHRGAGRTERAHGRAVPRARLPELRARLSRSTTT